MTRSRKKIFQHIKNGPLFFYKPIKLATYSLPICNHLHIFGNIALLLNGHLFIFNKSDCLKITDEHFPTVISRMCNREFPWNYTCHKTHIDMVLSKAELFSIYMLKCIENKTRSMYWTIMMARGYEDNPERENLLGYIFILSHYPIFYY